MFYKKLIAWGLPVTWRFIQIGKDFMEYHIRIKPCDISEYASFLIEHGCDEKLLPELIWNKDTNEINSILNKLIIKENKSVEIERRKWIVYVVSCAMDMVSTPVTSEDLFMLDDLYSYLDYPNNYPWCKPGEYIKCQNTEQMICDHKKWINKELAFLRIADN